MASIKDKGNGVFLITVSRGRIDNKQQLVTKTFKPCTVSEKGRKRSEKAIRADVERFAAKFEEEVKAGSYASSNAKKVTFEKYVDTWRDNYAAMRLNEHTQEDYEQILTLHIIPHIGGIKMENITHGHIQEIISSAVKSGKSAATVRKIFVVANSVFSYARKHEVIARNPCDRGVIDLPRVESISIDIDAGQQEHIFSVEQTRSFLNFCKKPYSVTVKARGKKSYTQQRSIPLQMQAYYHMAFYLGARRGELCALRWNDINWDDGAVRITKAVSITKRGQIEKSPKTKSGYRTLYMTEACQNMLHRWYLEAMEQSLMMGSQWNGYVGKDFDKNYIFIKEDGSQISVYTPYQSLKNAILQYNKHVAASEALPDIRLHDARHTAASSQISLGVSLADTSRNLGHSNTSTTSRIYIHGEKDSAHKARTVLEEALG